MYLYEFRSSEAIIPIINSFSLLFDAVGPSNPNVGPHGSRHTLHPAAVMNWCTHGFAFQGDTIEVHYSINHVYRKDAARCIQITVQALDCEDRNSDRICGRTAGCTVIDTPDKL